MLLCPREVANRLGISLSLVYQLCKNQRLQHYRMGGENRRGSIRIDEAEVQRYLGECLRIQAIPDTNQFKHIDLSANT